MKPSDPVGSDFQRGLLEENSAEKCKHIPRIIPYNVVLVLNIVGILRIPQVRAIAEGQLLSMRGHCERIGMAIPPHRIIATEGASANRHLLKLAAKVFGCDVYAADRSVEAELFEFWIRYSTR